jgi:hypothetical protein
MRRRGSGLGRSRPSLLGTAARTAVIAGTAQSVSGRVARRQQEAAEARAAPKAAPRAAPKTARKAAAPPALLTDAQVDQLKKLAELRDAGVLTTEEFATMRGRLLPL